MNFLKSLFRGPAQPSDRASTFYVRPKRCQEIIPVRIDTYNEVSLTDEGDYYARKIVRGARCPFPAELHLYLDKDRRLVKVEVTDGEQVSAEEYEAWVAEKQKTGPVG